MLGTVKQRARRGRKALGREAGAALGQLQGPGITVRGRQRGLNLRWEPRSASRARLTVDLDIVGAALSAVRTPVNFVQIGAYDGRANDPVVELVRRFGWHGVLVEPQPEAFSRLRKTYAGVEGLEFVNAAVAQERGEMTLWRFTETEPSDPPWLSQLASFDRSHLVKHAGTSTALLERIVGESVPAITLDDVFARAPDRVDVLQIDVEGYDAEIIDMLNLQAHNLAVVRFEHRHLPTRDFEAALSTLVAAGYAINVCDTDTIAVRRPFE